MVFFTDPYNAVSLHRLPSKTKIWKINGTLIILFYYSPSSPQIQRLCFFYQKHDKNDSSASGWWEYTNSCFKENARTFSKDSTTQKILEFQNWKKDYDISTKLKLQTRN